MWPYDIKAAMLKLFKKLNNSKVHMAQFLHIS